MIVPRGTIAPFALLVALATTTIVFVAGVGQAPSAFLGGPEVVLLAPHDDLPGKGFVSASSVEPLRALPHVLDVSPEIYVLTTIDGGSAFVRGVEFSAMLAFEGGKLAEGRLPQDPNEALVGSAFATSHATRVGDELLIPSSFLRFAQPVRVVGIVETATPARDEVWISLEAARALADAPAGQVHMIRARSSDPANLTKLISSFVPQFSYSGITISAEDVVQGQPLTIRGNVTNWGRVEGTKRVSVHAEGALVAEIDVRVPAHETVPFGVAFTLDGPGTPHVTINPTFVVNVREPTLHFAERPSSIFVGEPFTVQLVTTKKLPAAAVIIRGAGADAMTDEQGRAQLILTEPASEVILVAYVSGTPQLAARIPVVEEFAKGGRIVVTGMSTAEGAIGNTTLIHVNVALANVGDEFQERTFDLTLDGEPAGSAIATLEPGRSGGVTFEVGPLPEGTYTLALNGTSASLSITVYGGPDPEVEAFLRAERPTGSFTPPPAFSNSGEEYISRIVGNIRSVILVLSFLSALLAALGVVFVLVRHLAEAEPRIGIYRAIGATNARVSSLVEREVSARMAIGAAIGIVLGVGAAEWIAATGIVRAFGHTIRVVYPLWSLLLIYVLSIGLAVATARVILAYSLRTPVDHLLRGSTLRPLPTDAMTLTEFLEERA